MSNAKTFAEQEIQILLDTTPEGDRALIADFVPEILALVDKFGNSGQSGGSAPYTAGAIAEAVRKLCLFMPIAPVTGDAAEWIEVGDNQFQNRRCSALFKEGVDGRAYYLDAITWKTPKGICYGGKAKTADGGTVGSTQYVKFPFTPKTFYVDVDEFEIAPNDWEFTVKGDLTEAFEYYDRYE